jgi:hypothetical protein
MTMNKIELVRQLREVAAVLKPLTESALPGSAQWDGKQYVKGRGKQPDPYALSWWSMLSVIADLLEAQGAPLNDAQLQYLERTLLGGMGSLNDLHFDSGTLGTVAESVNTALDQKRRELHATFRCG